MLKDEVHERGTVPGRVLAPEQRVRERVHAGLHGSRAALLRGGAERGVGDGVEGAHLVKRKGEADETHYDIAIDGFFLAIGHKPNTDVFRPAVECDETGYIKTIGSTPRTNVDGVFAAGDCADPTYRQAIVAAGSGCKAALEAERWLTEHNK